MTSPPAPSPEALAAMVARVDAGASVPEEALRGLETLALAQGVAPFIAAACAGAPALLLRARQALAGRELATRAALERLALRFADAGVEPLLVKGEALARDGTYPQPASRARGDVDLWLEAGAFEAAARVLEADGWRARVAADGEWVQPERSYEAPDGAAFPIDLHRRPFAQPDLAAAVPVADLRARAVRVDGWWVPQRADAILVCVLHRYAHHADTAALQWTLDLARLAGDPQILEVAFARARDAGVASLLQAALREAAITFPHRIDARSLPAEPIRDRASALLGPMGPFRRWWLDFSALPDFAAKRRALREVLLPSRAFMRAAHGGDAPIDYLRRALRGLARRTRRGA